MTLENAMRIAAIFSLALFAAPAAAQEAIPLKWSLKEGDKFYVKDDTEVKMLMSFMGMKQDGTVSSVTVQRFKVISVKNDSTTIEMTTMKMEIKAEGPGDSPILKKIAERMRGTSVTAVFDENMKVTKLQDYDKFLDKLSENDKDERKQMKEHVTETSVIEMFNQVFSISPKKPVKTGDSWQRDEKKSYGGIDADCKLKFKLNSVSGDTAKLGYTGDLTFKTDNIPGLPEGIEVDKLDMKADSFGGTMKFDTKTGRLTENLLDSEAHGTVTIAAGGQKLEMSMKIAIKQKITIEDKNPVKD